jgi:cobyrinic acid a,c-diamide synthase
VSAPGLIFAAPASGSGKTTLVAGLLRLLRRRGLQISAAKLGPDYIDPAFHTAALGRPCLNIDLWAMRPATVTALREHLSNGAALTVVEGAMGLFDGAADGTASAADFAALTGWPVILVVDARGQAHSAGALLGGFAKHRADVAVAGVIFNRIGGPSHETALRQAAEPLGIPVLGCLPRAADLVLPERHLGLVQAGEHADLDAFLDRLADRLEARLDIDRLLDLARPARLPPSAGAAGTLLPLGQRIAVACDAAFAFSYAGQLDAWRNSGAEIELFSPLADEAPRAGCDAVYLPGGYPELHAGRLAAGERFLGGLRDAAARGAVLFGYREAALLAAGPLGATGASFRGHEFHYATVLDEGEGEALFDCSDALGRTLGAVGRRRGKVAGSFIHLIDSRDGRSGS